MVKLNTIIYSI